MKRISLFALLASAAAGLHAQTPVVDRINPTSAVAGASNFALGVSGGNFSRGDVVMWNAVELVTLFESSTRLFATVPATLIATPGTARVAVVSAAGLRSNELPFTVATRLAINTTALPSLVPGSPYTATVVASGGQPPYRWSPNRELPAGFALSAGGVITGTPSGPQALEFDLKVEDAGTQTATRLLTATIEPPALAIRTARFADGRVGQAYSTTLEATGGTPPYRWQVAAGSLPSGLRLDGATGTVSGTPVSAASAEFAIEVRDAANRAAGRVFTMAIAAGPLTIETTSLPPAVAGRNYNQVLAASGGTPPYRWTLTAETDVLRIDPATGVLEGTPREAGTLSLTVRVGDAAGAAVSRTLTLSVQTAPLAITSTALPGGSTGNAYSQTLAASGGQVPYVWAVTAGSAPGLTLQADTGVLAGTPTSAGSFPLAFQVRDAAGASASRTLTLVVTASPLTISGAGRLPGANLNQAYEHQLVAAGGSAPYTWSATGLPEGLTLGGSTGLLQGTPVSPGSFSFVVRVGDATGASAVELFQLEVAFPALPELRIEGLSAVSQPADQATLRVSVRGTFPVAIAGQLQLTFTPDSGAGDSTIRFASGGRTAAFTLPAGSSAIEAAVPLAIQTGTVAGTITVAARLTANGVDITPSPAPSIVTRIERAAPVIQNIRLTRTADGLTVQITGYSTPREVTQAVFTFSSSAGALQTATVTASVEEAFSRWFQDAASTAFGSQFIFTQNFTVSGGAASSITLNSVALSNRQGSTTSTNITP
ncbi:MAG: putative Ig domain-containing protein [Bryobacterales bacterium]|nr:putative Ig domain-containing protein [Bryobacterales bacterium]